MKNITEKLGLQGRITIKHSREIEEIIHGEMKKEKEKIKSRLEIILTDPDNYLRGQLKDLIKEL